MARATLSGTPWFSPPRSGRSFDLSASRFFSRRNPVLRATRHRDLGNLRCVSVSPYDASGFIGESDGHEHARFARQHLSQPRSFWTTICQSLAHSRHGSNDQQAADVALFYLGSTTKHLFAPNRVSDRGQPEPNRNHAGPASLRLMRTTQPRSLERFQSGKWNSHCFGKPPFS